MSGINETWKCKCRFNSSVYNNNNKRWNDDKYKCESKELIDKGVCDKGYVWNRSNCECECYKSCDFSEYLDYKSCKCKKRLVNKLAERSSAEECAENIEETKLVEINSTKCKHNACTLYIALLSLIFTGNIGIGIFFLYFHGYLKKKMFIVLSLVPALKEQFNEFINGKIQTNRDQN